MFMRFEPTKSTKGASKMRRDLINAEISKLRDLLPLPPTTRQRLSQLQLMALVCVYVRKMNYFQQLVKSHDLTYKFQESDSAPSIGFSKALSGFIMMLTQTGKLLYVSENAAEYLGHSMEDLLIHGDSIYDIIDRQDHQVVQTELNRGATGDTEDVPKIRNFLCRMNVSRNARRQLRFGDQKVVLVKGHFFSHLPLCSRNEPVFLAMCTPLAMPETRECVVHGATNVFTTVHAMDMKILHMDTNAQHYLGWEKSELTDASWYQLLHWDSLREAQIKHRLITQSVQDKCCILLVRMQKKCGQFIWVHVVLQVKDATDTPHQLVVATNQVLNDTEASIMMKNSWLYQYYGYQNQPCPLPIDPRCQKFFRREQAYPEYQEQYVCSTEGEDYYAGPFVQRTEEEWCRGYPGRPVDYSTHSPQSSLSDERSPHHYEYPTEVSLQGEIYVYPNTTPTKLEHEHLHYGIPEDVPSTIVSSEYNGDYDYSKIEYGKRMRVAPPPLCLEGTDGIDRWNPSPPWSDTALQKIPEHQRFTYQHIPLTPTERLATT